jgi:hypothetical protein
MIQALDAPAPNRVCLRVGLTEAGTARPEQILLLLGVSLDGIRTVREAIELSD